MDSKTKHEIAVLLEVIENAAIDIEANRCCNLVGCPCCSAIDGQPLTIGNAVDDIKTILEKEDRA